MDVCVRVFCVCVVLCVGRGLADPSFKESYRPCTELGKLKRRPKPNKRAPEPNDDDYDNNSIQFVFNNNNNNNNNNKQNGGNVIAL
jgi:hypothetical protein